VKAAAPNGKVVVTVAAGSHQVNVTAEGYQPYSAKLEAVKAQAVKVELKMIKKIVKQQEIRFATGSSRILPVSYPVLNNVADQIKKSCQAKKVIIEGHTDSQGSDAMNQKLSQARAEAVRKYLISQGISAALLEVQAYGESRPVADNATAEGREKNRRVEFIIVE